MKINQQIEQDLDKKTAINGKQLCQFNMNWNLLKVAYPW